MKPARVVATEASGAWRIEIRQYADGRFGFDRDAGEMKGDKSGRRKVRKKTLEAAKVAARKFLGGARTGKLDLLNINPRQYAKFLEWQANQLTAKSATVPELVKTYLESKRAMERQKELSEKHVSGLAGTLEPFAEVFPGEIAQVADDRAAVEKWLNSRVVSETNKEESTGQALTRSIDAKAGFQSNKNLRPISPRRWNNMREHIVSLIRYARAYKYLPPGVTAVEEIPKRKVTTKKETYDSDEFSALLRTVPLKWLPAIVLGGFCGIRPEELCPSAKSHKTPLQWSDFLWHKKTIRVPANVSKDGQRHGRVRWVPIGETALEWLAPWRNATGPCVPRAKMGNKVSTWAKRAGLERWKADGLRHSYASYRLAVTGEIGQLSEAMGNSVQIIRKHYLDARPLDEALQYFDLTPSRVGRSDINTAIAIAL